VTYFNEEDHTKAR
jgi:hypothetical protein